eukprot:1141452-Karenia_brevis.AAC.1
MEMLLTSYGRRQAEESVVRIHPLMEQTHFADEKISSRIGRSSAQMPFIQIRAVSKASYPAAESIS